jgi:hypothetical protein
MDRGSGRNQAILVAVIAAAATVAAASIGVLKSSDPPPAVGSTTSPTPSSHPDFRLGHGKAVYPVHIVRFSIGQKGAFRFIVVTGQLDAPETDQRIVIFAVAAPVDREPARPGPDTTESQRWYVSDPIAPRPDGSWEAHISIDATEQRELMVAPVVESVCDPPGKTSFCPHDGIIGNTSILTTGQVAHLIQSFPLEIAERDGVRIVVPPP